MELYWQDITQRGEEKSYEKLKNMLRNHLERKRLDRNKDAWDKDHKTGGGGNRALAGREAAPSNGPKRGDCRQWAKDGKCSRGDSCPWKGSHTEDKTGQRGRSPSRQKSPGQGKPKGKGKEKSQERGKSPGGAGKKDMAESLSELQQPNLPRRGANRLRAKRIAHHVTCI